MSQHQPKIVERRRDVRVRPAADYEVKAELVVGGLATPLNVLDISVGGIGVLVSHALAVFRVGDEVGMKLSVRGGLPIKIIANIRHIGPKGFGVCGMAFLEMEDDGRAAVRRCVSELLQRGQHF